MEYLNETKTHGISFGGNSKNKKLHSISDANYARCIDTRRSRHGSIICLNNGAILWKSTMQHTVALSSMESEYIGGCELARNVNWLNQALKEFGLRSKKSQNETGYIDTNLLDLNSKNPIKLYLDNKSAIIFAEEPMVQQRSRHIDVKYHYIREKVNDKLLELEFIPTKEMTADILTKPLPAPQFRKLRTKLGVLSLEGFQGCVKL